MLPLLFAGQPNSIVLSKNSSMVLRMEHIVV